MILLLSGGVDSVAAWRLLGLCGAVNFDMGTKPQGREDTALAWAQFHFGKRFIRRPLPMGEHETENGYLPFRNSLLILAAAQIDPCVAIGQISEWAPDKNRRFYRRLERAVNVEGQLAKFDSRLRVVAPFAAISKGGLIARYCREFGKDETDALLENTWSCYGDGLKHCGRCGGCQQRWNAEVHFAALTGVALNDALSAYEQEPVFVPTPTRDKARWLRDSGPVLGVQQIWARYRQNDSAKRLHAVRGPGLWTGL